MLILVILEMPTVLILHSLTLGGGGGGENIVMLVNDFRSSLTHNVYECI